MSEIRLNFPLRGLNTFGVACVAARYATFSDTVELTDLIGQAEIRNNPILILGGGSNLLFTTDFNGTVLHNQLRGIECIREDADSYYVRVQAGENWHQFVQECIRNNWAGVENLSLIPGSTGASPIQNIGAYGVEVRDLIHSVDVIHIQTGETHSFSNAECMFGYRDSIFKQQEKGKWVIIAVTFRLLRRPDFRTTYGSIQEELDRMKIEHLSIAAVSQAVVNIRKSKLPDPAVLGNAGSFFKNPVISADHYHKLKEQYPDIPSYPVNEESVKVPAGWMIERAGWKGKRINQCGVHDRQALVLVNYGGATGSEIYALSQQIIDDIQSRFSIILEREVNIL